MANQCPVCQSSVASWLLSKERFECQSCGLALTSNSTKVLKQSFILGFVLWLLFILAVQQYSGSLGYALAVSIEGGGILCGLLATAYYQLKVGVAEHVDK
ncbi:hypothetical protein DV711_02615 [Motiliproteus coralliicola]|uniref:Uncharacterized protein n=1 Tax=Motiliproteus coralliicola TaxID=2283196 RepID=A0A369WQZ6_9GAMM|nr:hypothetical protein [Motiliproteus coralliicola]RDE24500.1 hypothetical protein DV711_02615 [Motiliproteus coralliicola]